MSHRSAELPPTSTWFLIQRVLPVILSRMSRRRGQSRGSATTAGYSGSRVLAIRAGESTA